MAGQIRCIYKSPTFTERLIISIINTQVKYTVQYEDIHTRTEDMHDFLHRFPLLEISMKRKTNLEAN